MKKCLQAYLITFIATYLLIIIFALFVGKPPNADLSNEPITNLVMRNWWEIWAAISTIFSTALGLLVSLSGFFILLMRKFSYRKTYL